jgi:hypothetical protein
MAHANTLATWLTIASIIVGGGIWVGSVASDLKSNEKNTVENKQQIDKLRNEGPPAIARLETEVKNLREDVGKVQDSQDEILRELRKN